MYIAVVEVVDNGVNVIMEEEVVGVEVIVV